MAAAGSAMAYAGRPKLVKMEMHEPLPWRCKNGTRNMRLLCIKSPLVFGDAFETVLSLCTSPSHDALHKEVEHVLNKAVKRSLDACALGRHPEVNEEAEEPA